MDCLNCQHCYSHEFINTLTHSSCFKYRCKVKGHREIEHIPEGQKGKGKCSDFKSKALHGNKA